MGGRQSHRNQTLLRKALQSIQLFLSEKGQKYLMPEKSIYLHKMLGNILSLNIFDTAKNVSAYNTKTYSFLSNYSNSKFLCTSEPPSNELLIKPIQTLKTVSLEIITKSVSLS